MTGVAPPDPPLATNRILLRPFKVSDARAVAEACGDPVIPRHTMMPEGLTQEQAKRWIERGLDGWAHGLARFAITLPPSERCVGQIGIQFDPRVRRAETFYWLDRAQRGTGIASEALELVTTWAFRDFDIARVQLVTNLDNDASQQVAERCGFTREGVLRSWEPVKDSQPDVVMFSRLADEPGLDSLDR
ncbi:MAG: GNAT family protein [Actinomycetota bacterium]